MVTVLGGADRLLAGVPRPDPVQRPADPGEHRARPPRRRSDPDRGGPRPGHERAADALPRAAAAGLPVIIGGIRTATVLVVGTATLVTPVGGASLGNYIFSGLESMNPASTVFGCVVAALLAVVMDQLVRLLEVAARRRSRALAWVGGARPAAGPRRRAASPLARLFDPAASEPSSPAGRSPSSTSSTNSWRGAARAGFRPDQRVGMSEGIQIEALRHNQIDCMVNYSGNIWTLVMKYKDFLDRQATIDEITRYLADEDGIVCLGTLGFENAYGFALPESQAEQLKVHSLADLRAPGRRADEGGSETEDRRRHPVLPAAGVVAREGRLRIEGRGRRNDADGPDVYVRGRERRPGGRHRGLHQRRPYPILPSGGAGRPGAALPPYDAVLLFSPAAAKRPGFAESAVPCYWGKCPRRPCEGELRVDMEKWPARRAAAELDGKFTVAGGREP